MCIRDRCKTVSEELAAGWRFVYVVARREERIFMEGRVTGEIAESH